MKEKISIEDMKNIEFDILCQIDDICQSENIRYTLCGGTLLGAVRHGGFIPWDDDIDIAIPRPDYNRFIAYCMDNDVPFGLVSYQNDESFCYLYAKAYDKNTIVVEESANRWNSKYGVYVDIFPIDGLGNTYKNAVNTVNKSRFNREILTAANWTKFSRSKTRAWYYEFIRLAFYLISRFVNPQRLIQKIEVTYANIDFDASSFVGIVSGSYRNKEIMPNTTYSTYSNISFEGREFSIIVNYDNYLSEIYGDYMKLPPLEKQVTHHSFDAYRVEKIY